MTDYERDAQRGQLCAGFSVRVDMSEIAGWSAENIAAFFNGVAQVHAAANRRPSVVKARYERAAAALGPEEV